MQQQNISKGRTPDTNPTSTNLSQSNPLNATRFPGVLIAQVCKVANGREVPEKLAVHTYTSLALVSIVDRELIRIIESGAEKTLM